MLIVVIVLILIVPTMIVPTMSLLSMLLSLLLCSRLRVRHGLRGYRAGDLRLWSRLCLLPYRLECRPRRWLCRLRDLRRLPYRLECRLRTRLSRLGWTSLRLKALLRR
jgi:hypothetical protein